MKRFLIALALVCTPGTALADSCGVGLGNVFTPAQVTSLCKVGTGMVPQAPGTDNTISAGTVSKRLKDVWTAGSVSGDTFAYGPYTTANLPVLASTPVADVNMCDGAYNAITSASANHACIMNDATGVGKGPSTICNFSGQTVRIKGGAGVSLSGSSVAGAYTTLADGGCATFFRRSSTKVDVFTHSIPTISASP